jgi:hypothetical protein
VGAQAVENGLGAREVGLRKLQSRQLQPGRQFRSQLECPAPGASRGLGILLQGRYVAQPEPHLEAVGVVGQDDPQLGGRAYRVADRNQAFG